MQITVPSGSQLIAVSRHVGTSVATVVGIGALFVNMSPEQQQSIIDSVQHIMHGLEEVITGCSALGVTLSAIYAAYSASRKSQLAAVTNNNPDVQVQPVTDKGAALIASVTK